MEKLHSLVGGMWLLTVGVGAAKAYFDPASGKMAE